MKFIVKTVLETCHDCRYKDHSGGYTPRGLRWICGNTAACAERRSKKDFLEEYPELSITQDIWQYHWYHRVTDGIIPVWCPLKHGGKY